MRIAVALVGFLVILAVGAMAVIASVPIHPSTQSVERVVPDDQLPR